MGKLFGLGVKSECGFFILKFKMESKIIIIIIIILKIIIITLFQEDNIFGRVASLTYGP